MITQLRFRMKVALWISAFVLLGGVVYVVVKYSSVNEAHKLGFDHVFAATIKTVSGHQRKTQVFWNDLLVVPGDHPILVRIWNSANSYHDCRFSSGDRLALRTVTINHHADS